MTATDPDTNATITLTLTDGNGSQHNHLFTIDANGTLRTTASFDYETNGTTLHIRVKATDEHNASLAKTFAISLLNVNEPPADLNATAPLNITENQPIGTIVGEFNANDPDANTNLTFTLVEGSNDNHLFAIDANGTLRTVALFDYETNATFTIRAKARDQYNAWIKENFTITITNLVEDLDGDGIEDYYDADDDGDGFSDAAEISYGSDPRDNQSVANQAPSAIDLNGTSVAENLPGGTIVGEFNATDPDANATITLTFTDGNGSQHNNLFSIDANGTLRTIATFDYETDSTALHIRVKATDEHNASIEKVFAISVTNVVEDLDGDGIEDHVDPDDDGDGFSDTTEVAYGSDPRDNQSVANQAPTQLDLNGTSVTENSPTGSVVGILNATDPDANATVILTFADGNGSQHNSLFSIDANGTLRTTATFDYETNATALHIRVKATDEHNASMEKAFSITVTNVVEDFDSDGIEDHYDPDDDGDGFSDAVEVTAGTDPMDAASVPNHPPNAITLNNLRVAEGRPAGDLVANVGISDPDDVNGTGNYAYALVDGNGSSRQRLLHLGRERNPANVQSPLPRKQRLASHPHPSNGRAQRNYGKEFRNRDHRLAGSGTGSVHSDRAQLAKLAIGSSTRWSPSPGLVYLRLVRVLPSHDISLAVPRRPRLDLRRGRRNGQQRLAMERRPRMAMDGPRPLPLPLPPRRPNLDLFPGPQERPAPLLQPLHAQRRSVSREAEKAIRTG